MPRRRSWRRWTNWRHAGYPRAAARGAGATARRQHQPVDLPGRPAGALWLHLLAVRAPGQSGERRLSMHKGIDFAAPAGSDVVAVAAGW